MIAEKTMYHVICDGCGTDAQKGAEHGAWPERDATRFEPWARGWWTDDGDRDLCPDCWAQSDVAFTRESAP